MLTELNNRSSTVGFKMNIMKTQFMRSKDLQQDCLIVGSDEIEEVKDNVY